MISLERRWKRKEMQCSGNVRFGRCMELPRVAKKWNGRAKSGNAQA
nr:MAG TPA: hypothetical protein [Ackermannviridae sp.]